MQFFLVLGEIASTYPRPAAPRKSEW